MTLNPKKMRPYDEPPKRRRSLVPSAPDSAATAFIVAAALWFVLATSLGALAVGLRIVPFELDYPLGVLDLGFRLNADRVEYAFVNATVYGWLTNAGFAAAAFMTPRLFGRRLALEPGLMLSVAIWNMSVLGGIASLYVFEIQPHAPLTAFPWLIDGGMATAAFIVTAAFFMTTGAAVARGYVSAWFSAVALLGLLGLLTVNAALSFFDLPDLLTALGSVFVERAIMTVWLLGVALAVLHYVVPRSGGVPLSSAGIAALSFVAWLVVAPTSALGTLTDASVPYAVTTLGAVSTMLLLIPTSLVLINLSLSLTGRWTLVFSAGAAAFAVSALAFLFGTSLLDAIGALRAVHLRLDGTDWETGVFVWATYGAFTLAALALAEHALPRLLRRAWGGGLLSAAQLWLTFGGATIAGIALMGAGLAEGSLLGEGISPDALGATLMPYRVPAVAGFGLLALGGLLHVVSLFLLYSSGQPAEYVVPGRSTATAAGH